MKKAILMATLATFVAVPALANDPAKFDEKFTKLDSNSDGQVSKEEHAAAKEEKFEEADTNNDGNLSKEELKAAWEHKKEEHKS